MNTVEKSSGQDKYYAYSKDSKCDTIPCSSSYLLVCQNKLARKQTNTTPLYTFSQLGILALGLRRPLIYSETEPKLII